MCVEDVEQEIGELGEEYGWIHHMQKRCKICNSERTDEWKYKGCSLMHSGYTGGLQTFTQPFASNKIIPNPTKVKHSPEKLQSFLISVNILQQCSIRTARAIILYLVSEEPEGRFGRTLCGGNAVTLECATNVTHRQRFKNFTSAYLKHVC